jgi:hypothetical protein
MSAAKFFTDEDIYAAVVPALRRAGLDAVSTPEAGRLGESDESQLAWAAKLASKRRTCNAPSRRIAGVGGSGAGIKAR